MPTPSFGAPFRFNHDKLFQYSFQDIFPHIKKPLVYRIMRTMTFVQRVKSGSEKSTVQPLDIDTVRQEVAHSIRIPVGALVL